jgi:Bacterial dnaA protein helix-turn-helix
MHGRGFGKYNIGKKILYGEWQQVMSNCEFAYRAAIESEPGDGEARQSGSAAVFLSAIVSAAFGLRPEALGAGGRGPADVAFARQVAMYLAYTRLRVPYVTAGNMFGRDRTTARHACRTVEDRREDPRIDSILDYLERAIDLRPRPEARS